MSMVTNVFYEFLTVFQVFAYIALKVSGDDTNHTGVTLNFTIIPEEAGVDFLHLCQLTSLCDVSVYTVCI